MRGKVVITQKPSIDASTIDYQALFNSLPNPYIAFLPNDPVFTIVAENQAHADAAFSIPEQAIGKPTFDVFPDNSEKYKTTGVSDLLESFRTVIRTGKPDVMPLLNYDVRDADGKFVTKWWRVTHYPVFDAAGTLLMFYQATEDKTNEILAQEKFELTQSQLDSALAIGLVSTWSWNIATDTVTGDKNLAHSFGVKPEEAATGMPLKKFTDVIHPDDQARVIAAIQHSVAHNLDYAEEFRTVNQKGEIMWVIARGRVQKDSTHKPAYFLGVLVDITERKAAEAELERIKSMFNALFESTILSVAMADLQGNILQANKTFLKTFGYTRKEFQRGFTSQQITPTKSRSITSKIYDELRATGEAEPTEKEYVRKDGTAVPMLVGAAMLPGSKEQFMAFMLDISENKELKALNKAKDEFIGMASHQLRTPATVVKQYISLLQSGFAGKLTVEQQVFADKAYNSNERQLRIVNDLLKTAQIDSDRYILKKEHVDVSTVINDAIAELNEPIALKQQSVDCQHKVAGAKVFVDRTELNLVLVNIVENASKYSPDKSTITVRSRVAGGHVVISIRDEGVGIAADDISRIFHKFTRVDNTLSDTVNGSGLGLYWVERVVRLHGGSIEVASKPGVGSTFTVNIPYET